MSEEQPSEPSHHRSWLERLSLALLGEPKTREELLELLREAQQRDLLDMDALAMIEGVMRVSEQQVRDVMIPRSQMVVVERDWSLERLLAEVIESGHSRFPVIGENRDDVIGILIVKDLLRYFAQGTSPFRLEDVLRPAKFIPESKRLNVLLREFRSTRLHMAIVIDEYGGVAGLVTIEDVLEEIVGEIDDEYDIDRPPDFIRPQGERQFLIQALTPVEEFNDYFGTRFSDDKADTIGGLVMMELGHLPKRGETVAIDNCRFRVLRADNRRVHLLELTLSEEQSAPSADARAPRP
jgi:magnesium and cobalt transporter